MTLSKFAQIFDTINFGLVVFDRDLTVQHWNRWMAMHSGISATQIVGEAAFDFFPQLNTVSFKKNCKSVLAFGNFAFFSQKLHGFLFPFKPDSSFDSRFDMMQQSCSMGPLRSEDNSISGIFLIVQDVTELANYEHKLVEMNTKDALTGIYNRRFLESRLKDECARQQRYLRPLSLIMIDIDFFKKVNDSYGHQGGDFILQAVAARAASVIRKTDFFARYGGEEFCCLLPETGAEAAESVAESLRGHIEEMANRFDDKIIKVTISLGISALLADDSPDTLLKRADDALYQAKNSGRNRFVRI